MNRSDLIISLLSKINSQKDIKICGCSTEILDNKKFNVNLKYTHLPKPTSLCAKFVTIQGDTSKDTVDSLYTQYYIQVFPERF